MNPQIKLIILALTTFSCSDPTTKEDKLVTPNVQQKKENIFELVSDFPIIKDTSRFIHDLRQSFNLKVHESPVQKKNEKITSFKKVKLYGSEKDFIFIEYDWNVGSMADYPWRYQLLMTTDGKLIKSLNGLRFEFVKIFPQQNPFLLILIASAQGNGGHEIYTISSDSLENIYEGYFDYTVQTYDAHHDNSIYEPEELILKIKDYNNDGMNDIAFVGTKLIIQGQTKNGEWFDRETLKNGKTITYSAKNPFKKIPIEFVFFYDKKSEHFIAKENYGEQY